MKNPDNPLEPDFVESLKNHLLESITVYMEGTVNRESAENWQMFDELFDELLQEEPVVLSRAE